MTATQLAAVPLDSARTCHSRESDSVNGPSAAALTLTTDDMDTVADAIVARDASDGPTRP